MARAAGNSTHYTFRLDNRPEVTIELPSVTTIIKAVLNSSFAGASYWGFGLGLRAAFPDMPDDEFEVVLKQAKDSEHAPNRVRDKAGDRGTSTHDYLEALAKGETPPAGSKYEEAVLAWWLADMDGWAVVGAEVPCFSLREGFAGTVDLVRERNGQYEVIDLKTHSGSARFDDKLQIAAYDLALTEMGVIPASAPVQHGVLLARDTGKYTFWRGYTDPALFLKTRDLWKGAK